MKKLKYVVISSILILLNSCSHESVVDYSEWKSKNQDYFKNMNDSVDFKYDSILTNYGYMFYYYNIIVEGDTTSTSPDYYDKVKVNYKGQDIEGNIFDKTYSGLNPITDSTATPVVFYTNSLILGWTANLMKMKEGEIRTIILPSELGYGSYGAGTVILPYSTLRFDIQLVSVIK